MLEAAMWAASQAIKVLGIVGIWMIVKYIIRNGSDTLEDVLETLSMTTKAVCLKLKRMAWERIKRERNPEQTEAEGSVS